MQPLSIFTQVLSTFTQLKHLIFKTLTLCLTWQYSNFTYLQSMCLQFSLGSAHDAPILMEFERKKMHKAIIKMKIGF